MKNKELIYWADLTGPAVLDEIVRLTIMDTNNNVLFNHTFNTRLVDWLVNTKTKSNQYLMIQAS